ncbi:hypothetical protein BD779DRAFT_1477407 [Infundibulicybe gibba]|nr:hypothetical protein BD779DRAFT_1477407 [Infundibulicybe gibba]
MPTNSPKKNWITGMFDELAEGVSDANMEISPFPRNQETWGQLATANTSSPTPPSSSRDRESWALKIVSSCPPQQPPTTLYTPQHQPARSGSACRKRDADTAPPRNRGDGDGCTHKRSAAEPKALKQGQAHCIAGGIVTLAHVGLRNCLALRTVRLVGCGGRKVEGDMEQAVSTLSLELRAVL